MQTLAKKLFFRTKYPQVVDGVLVSSSPITSNEVLTTGSVEYYFSIQKDHEVPPSLACKYIEQFNSENYLIDLDFDCSNIDGQDICAAIRSSMSKINQNEVNQV